MNAADADFGCCDCRERRAVGVTAGVLASKTTTASSIPKLFWKQIENTVGAWTGEKAVDFIGADGKTAWVAVP